MAELPPILPDPVASRRQTAGSLVRFIYASIVIGLGLFLGWQLVKPLIYTQSSGSVVAPYYVVSTPFTARIVELSANPGETVEKNEVVAVVRSPEIDSLRANLLKSVADQVNKEADLRIRLIVATESLDSALDRVEASNECSDKLKKYPGSVTSVFRAQILRECADAAAQLARIEAEITETEKQLKAVQRARAEIEDVKNFVDRAFNNGRQLAPIKGVVANNTANPGQSVTAGTSIVEIYDPTKLYVQWILSADRLTQPSVGAPVYVLDGNSVMRAVIKQVYSIAEESTEGTTIFARQRAGQLARIELVDGDRYPAYMSDVEIRYYYWRFLDRAVDFYVRIMTKLGIWRG